MAMELIKENIEYEQLLGENTADTVVREEYVIPDTQPDVRHILMLDAKPCITIKEVTQDKVYVEGQIEYNVLYMAKEEEKTGVYNVTYRAKFANSIEMPGASPDMLCEASCYVEHMDCSIINERKVCIEGILRIKGEIYKKYDFKIVKDVREAGDTQFLKNPISIDKIIGNVSEDLLGKAHMHVDIDKPEIGKIIKCNIHIHKQDIKLLEGRIQLEALAQIHMLYKGKDTRELNFIKDEVLLSKELELEKVLPDMEQYTEFIVDTMEFDIKEDDLGEKRIIDMEFLTKANVRVMCKEEMDMIEDAYSPTVTMDMNKKEYELNVLQGQNVVETLVKGDIEIEAGAPKPIKIIMSNGEVCITDKKVLEDKVVVEGVMNVKVLYRTADEEKYVCAVTEEIPFNCPIEMQGTKINMKCICKVFLDNLETDLEAGNIAVRAVVKVYSRVNYVDHKKFLVDMCPIEGEVPHKKASITIYVVQSGDTLWKIAKKYNTTIEEIARINEIENPDEIKVGQKLIIPGRAII